MLDAAHFPKLIETIASGLRVIGTRGEGDGQPLTEELVMERARNIAAAVAGTFDMAPAHEVKS